MRVIGIEFSSNILSYVVVEKIEGDLNISSANRIMLGETRDRDSLTAFQDAVITLYGAEQPNLIGIKAKPESGRLQAGAAALKMEGIAVANAPCPVDFISGVRINRSEVPENNLYAYFQTALKAGVAALDRAE
jgi:hypothetical protein